MVVIFGMLKCTAKFSNYENQVRWKSDVASRDNDNAKLLNEWPWILTYRAWWIFELRIVLL